MWIIRSESSKELEYYILFGKEYTVGRRDCNIALQNDITISRKHAIIWISRIGTAYYLHLKDISKLGTQVANERINNGTERKLNNLDLISFGTAGISKFIVYEQNITLTTSCLQITSKKHLRDYLLRLCGQLVSEWTSECQFVVMETIVVTAKVVSALLHGRHLVTPDYFKDLIIAVETKTKHPNPQDYLPSVSDQKISLSAATFEPDASRQNIFRGKVFYFLTEIQNQRLLPVLSLAGATCCTVTDTNFDLLISDSSIVVMPDQSELSNVKRTVENVVAFLKRHNRRFILEAEIGYAVILNSLTTYCNPVQPSAHDSDASTMSLSNHTQECAPSTLDVDQNIEESAYAAKKQAYITHKNTGVEIAYADNTGVESAHESKKQAYFALKNTGVEKKDSDSLVSRKRDFEGNNVEGISATRMIGTGQEMKEMNKSVNIHSDAADMSASRTENKTLDIKEEFKDRNNSQQLQPNRNDLIGLKIVNTNERMPVLKNVNECQPNVNLHFKAGNLNKSETGKRKSNSDRKGGLKKKKLCDEVVTVIYDSCDEDDLNHDVSDCTDNNRDNDLNRKQKVRRAFPTCDDTQPVKDCVISNADDKTMPYLELVDSSAFNGDTVPALIIPETQEEVTKDQQSMFNNITDDVISNYAKTYKELPFCSNLNGALNIETQVSPVGRAACNTGINSVTTAANDNYSTDMLHNCLDNNKLNLNKETNQLAPATSTCTVINSVTMTTKVRCLTNTSNGSSDSTKGDYVKTCDNFNDILNIESKGNLCVTTAGSNIENKSIISLTSVTNNAASNVSSRVIEKDFEEMAVNKSLSIEKMEANTNVLVKKMLTDSNNSSSNHNALIICDQSWFNVDNKAEHKDDSFQQRDDLPVNLVVVETVSLLRPKLTVTRTESTAIDSVVINFKKFRCRENTQANVPRIIGGRDLVPNKNNSKQEDLFLHFGDPKKNQTTLNGHNNIDISGKFD